MCPETLMVSTEEWKWIDVKLSGRTVTLAALLCLSRRITSLAIGTSKRTHKRQDGSFMPSSEQAIRETHTRFDGVSKAIDRPIEIASGEQQSAVVPGTSQWFHSAFGNLQASRGEGNSSDIAVQGIREVAAIVETRACGGDLPGILVKRKKELHKQCTRQTRNAMSDDAVFDAVASELGFYLKNKDARRVYGPMVPARQTLAYDICTLEPLGSATPDQVALWNRAFAKYADK
jgi:hypothetical protein